MDLGADQGLEPLGAEPFVGNATGRGSADFSGGLAPAALAVAIASTNTAQNRGAARQRVAMPKRWRACECIEGTAWG